MNNVSLEKRVGELLLQWGITPEIKGFQYIIDAVGLWDSDKRATEIYCEIADRRKNTWTAVERAIRTAFNELDFEKKDIKAYFGNAEKKNFKLISVIAWRLEKETETGGKSDEE